MIEAIAARLDEGSSRALANAVSRAVRDGALVEGDQLPPIRSVAAGLGLSPTTVSAAWALLARAGAIRTDGRRGTVVTSSGPGPVRYRQALEQRSVSPYLTDLSSGVPDPSLLPDLGPALRRLHGDSLPANYLDEPVLDDLRSTLQKDWPYDAEQLTITDGAMDALDLFVRTHLRFGDRVAVEQPSFPPLLDLLESAGVEMVPVNLDPHGPVPEELEAAVSRGVRAFFLQPRAQNPTGISLDRRRARALADVVRGGEVIVVEDDSAGAIARTDPLSLGRWLPGQVLHVRSFSKSHGPDLRLAAASGPAALVEPMVQRRFLGQGWSSRLLQALLLDLLVHPESVRQVEHARAEYARRRSAVVEQLRRLGVEVGGTDGLNIWLPVDDETAAMVRLAAEGIRVAAGGPFTLVASATPHVRVTVGLVQHDHAQLAAQLARAAAATPPRGRS